MRRFAALVPAEVVRRQPFGRACAARCSRGTLQATESARAERGREAEAFDEIAARRLLSPVGLVNGNGGSDVNAPIDF